MATAKIQVLSDGSMRGQSFELTKETVSLGRSESCDICIPDSTISGHHCTLITSGGDGEPRRTILRDEGSTNGTRYNYEKLEPEVEVELHDGDIFQAGGIELVYHSGEASHAEASRVGSVINLEETGAAERSTSVMKNMGTRTGVRKKGGADIRDSHAQKTVMMAIIAILALGALGAIGYLLLTMFGGK